MILSSAGSICSIFFAACADTTSKPLRARPPAAADSASIWRRETSLQISMVGLPHGLVIGRIVARIGRRRNRTNLVLRETLRMREMDRFYRRYDVVLTKVLMDRT